MGPGHTGEARCGHNSELHLYFSFFGTRIKDIEGIQNRAPKIYSAVCWDSQSPKKNLFGKEDVDDHVWLKHGAIQVLLPQKCPQTTPSPH